MQIVVADIGGTHARFALATVENGRVANLTDVLKMITAEHASLQTAWEAYADHLGRDLPRSAAIAIAAPMHGDVIKLTNNPWIVRPSMVRSKLGLDDHVLLNDFEAVAHAVGSADDRFFSSICGPNIPLPEDGVISVIGPGTGLGVALLVRRNGHNMVISTEGGHGDFAPLDGIEDQILASLREQHGRVSTERVVSGPGLRTILSVLAKIEDRAMPNLDDKSLWSAAIAGDDSLIAAALDRFCLSLGAIAGDIALAHGPGPVVIAGGLGLRLAEILPRSGFAERFAAKGRYQALMQKIPVKIVTHPEPGLFGAAAAFAENNSA